MLGNFFRLPILAEERKRLEIENNPKKDYIEKVETGDII